GSAPGERREVAVVASGGVVPVDAEGVQVTARGLRERELGGDGVADVLEVDRLALVGAGDALDGEVEHARNRDRAAHLAHLELDGLGLDTAEATDQRAGPAARPDVGHGQTESQLHASKYSPLMRH